jgi:O-antigen/teichoic acid export membrane protein
VGLTVAVVATLGFEAKPFLTFYIGESFANSGAALALLYLAVAFGAYGVASLDGVMLEAAGQPRRPAIAMVAGAVVGLVTLIALTKPYGVAGAAFGVASGALVTAILQLRAACELRQERVVDRAKRFLRAVVPPIVCAGVASTALHNVGVGGLYATAATAAAASVAVLPTLRSART